MTFTFERHAGPVTSEVIAEVAAVQTAVLPDAPWRLDVTPEGWARFLHSLLDTRPGLVLIVRHGPRAVGTTVGLPLADAPPVLHHPEPAFGSLKDRYLVTVPTLLPPYRGRGLGARFLRDAETHARAQGYRHTVIGVARPARDHPARGTDRPLPDYLARQGYHRQPERQAEATWPHASETPEIRLPLDVWLKELT